MSLDINKTDLYALLGVSEEATEKELVKAYRKSALKCHPDKNPDNPEAANEFQRLSKALELLTDSAARAAYDKARKAKKAAEERHKVLDSKRKKFKEDLEARERVADDKKADDVRAQRNLEAEIERLRKQGSSLLEQEQEYLRAELQRDQQEKMKAKKQEEAINVQHVETAVSPKLKISWKAAKDDDTNGGYTSSILRSLFGKYGDVSAVVVSGSKKGRGIVEYKHQRAASLAFKRETGLEDNPLTLKWLSGKPDESIGDTENVTFGSFQTDAAPGLFACSFQTNSSDYAAKKSYVPQTSQDRDFESLVLMKMRQAEERKRLIEQMQKEDEES